MELVELSEKQRMRREEAAQLLHDIADSLARHNSVDFLREGVKFQVRVPDQVEVEVEVEIETGESKLEIEIEW